MAYYYRPFYPKSDISETEKMLIHNLLENISSNWKLEAKLESEDLFYSVKNLPEIEDGKKCYVIGRKGMGKTAIAEHFQALADENPLSFSKRLSFKNFPFNILYNLKDTDYTAPNQFITIWKYLVYNSICEMMASNEEIDDKVSIVLKKLYPNDVVAQLNKKVKKWVATDFNVNILDFGAEIGGLHKECNEEESWIKRCDMLERVIQQFAGESKYYVLIDELDEDYRDFITQNEKDLYVQLLTSLFKAVQDIKSVFYRTELKIIPVVFLRSDIYSLIRDSDKNKWSDFKIDLTWNLDSLKRMLCHRLYVSSDRKLPEDIVWNKLFSCSYVMMGNQNRNQKDIFDYIARSTHWRPRDFTHYISECAKLALQKNEPQITPHIVKEVDNEFSEYLKGEIVDEVYADFYNIEDVMNLLSQLRKQTFSPAEFTQAYSENGYGTMADAKNVLFKLFEYGIIGNQPSMRGKQVFKHQYPNARFNNTESVIIHRGLYKALQIF